MVYLFLFLLGPEKKQHHRQRQVYVRRLRPSRCSIDLTEEIILDNGFDPDHVIEKVLFVK